MEDGPLNKESRSDKQVGFPIKSMRYSLSGSNHTRQDVALSLLQHLQPLAIRHDTLRLFLQRLSSLEDLIESRFSNHRLHGSENHELFLNSSPLELFNRLKTQFFRKDDSNFRVIDLTRTTLDTMLLFFVAFFRRFVMSSPP
ncbi:hypothetical protein Nepgr_001311 [Nepenthes gracilis]|uniref:Uncharacterized protein n=1 Tax=Nepenthes gracilis TaxID=150966 RepID=A0AAD3P515_NEPGR|nr:hypothetical protein Nepgr_001311 [Nepenthes gracilis]